METIFQSAEGLEFLNSEEKFLLIKNVLTPKLKSLEQVIVEMNLNI